MSFTDTETPSDEGIASNESIEFEPSADEVSGEANEGEFEGEAEGDESASAEGQSYRIKVQGQEREVTLDELINLAQMGDDYTRKTQELASEREALASLRALEQALQEDPRSTIEALQVALGLNEPAADEYLDPVERELAELKAWRAQQEEASRLAAIQREAADARTKHGLEVSDEDLVRFAYENRIGTLDAAARLYKAERQQTASVQQKQATTDAKRQASVIEGSTGRSRKATSAAPPSSIREAFAQALSELS